ncbi:hypothetical protein [Wenyingzhuangia sp. 2_MG-2023]|uniref:tetratricopeptide repeat protein n=1 Tax=Wenyingzhuangia sp. 2_MG-2023 TaxID=3062639 RepID=UPI0026E22576|nr:hypothetical protein [Wenyingzhuangia sp. 2_MG-2023]MDO6738379.1 hypothetical protein [Wenyingzhuangia sp. 2_MG-2023]
MKSRQVILGILMMMISLFVSSQEKDKVMVLQSIQQSLDTKDQRVLLGIHSLIEKKEYVKAKKRMSEYIVGHEKDAQINWLYAYVLHLNKNYTASSESYERAILLSSKDNNIKLDYARKLYERGKINKAEDLIYGLKNLDPASKAEGLVMLANINYWQGDISNSKRLIKDFRSEFPNSDKLDELSAKISRETAFYIKASYEMQTDTQPLEYSAQKAEAGIYKSMYLNPKLEIENYSFTPSATALIAKVSNQFYFSSIDLSVIAALGTYGNTEGSGFIGGVTVAKKLPFNTKVTLGYNIHPVLGTIASTTTNITETTVSGALDYSNKLLLTNLTYNQQLFDNNTIKNLVFWIITQPIKISNVAIQFGYSFGYSDSENVFFVEDEENSTSDAIVGIYDPYFTPKELESNSFLLKFNYQMFRFLEIGGATNYAVKAKALSPYLYSDGTSIVLDFPDEKTIFYPSESSVFIKYDINEKLSVKGTYTYQETFFYSRDNINFGVNYRF